MHLKRLTVHGFKSFADRTVFDFQRGGLTCIVGPNGCGKSNVFEAVKWTLGEQRPTSLRSRELTDVIFNGTVRRPPMGLCQGTLLFSNEDRALPLDDDEVEVTRRVFRTGDTEYLINGASARLKDVRDLFAGTGLGAGGYAFMEQGRIDQVLAANPVERRRVFEEAAGISRFRARRRETELKLKRVEDNLTRLHDITEEVERQVRSLKIHAGKARNHRDMTARVRDLQLAYSAHRWFEIQEEQGSLDEKLESLTKARDHHAEQREELREEMRTIEGRLEGIVEGVSDARSKNAEVQARIESAREKIAYQTANVERSAERRELKEAEIKSLREGLDGIEEERVVVVRDREALQQESDALQQTLAARMADVEKVRSEEAELVAARRTAEDYLRDLERREADLSRDEARLESELEHVSNRLAENEALKERLDREMTELREQRDARAGDQNEQTSTLEALRADLTGKERRAEELEKLFADSVESVREAESALGKVLARRDVLQGVMTKGEGLDEGTRALLNAQRQDSSIIPGFRGLLSDLFEVSLEEAPAFQAALRDLGGAVVVETLDDALKGLSWLRANDFGGTVFLPWDQFKNAAADQGASADLPLSMQASDDGVAHVLSILLGGLAIVEPNEVANYLGQASSAGACPILVTTEGETVEHGRVLRAKEGGADQGLIVLQAELQDLERRIPAMESARDNARERQEELRAEREQTRASIKEASVALVRTEGEAARIDQEIVRMVRELERLTERAGRLAEERSQSEERRTTATEKLEEAKDSREALKEDAAKASEALNAHRERLQSQANLRDQVTQALESIRIERATAMERVSSLESRERDLQSAATSSRQRLETDERDIAELEEARQISIQSVEEQQGALADFEASAAQVAKELQEREGEAESVRDSLRETAESLDAAEAAMGDHNERIASFRGREGELKAARESLLERTRDELEIDLEDPDQIPDIPDLSGYDGPPAPRADEGRAEEGVDESQALHEESEGNGIENQEAEAALEEALDGEPETGASEEAPEAQAAVEGAREIDWKAVEREIRTLRDRIARLGNVNLAAVEELEEAEKRATFILRERDDLLDSRDQLKKVLKNIETQSVEMFVSTFESVREHFSIIFRKLFGGGKAEMSLEDPSAPLESGIEIKARPPGKEFRSITLLSGGERTMTAVALLFAIFRANPAPCAFLDEVDAALDEDNTERFCMMLEEFFDHSQFVVVTHSKRTMERASLMYGVTMPERGVSRRVAVQLEQLDSEGRIRDLAAVNREAAKTTQDGEGDDGKASPSSSGTSEEPVPEAHLPELPKSLEATTSARRARKSKPNEAVAPDTHQEEEAE